MELASVARLLPLVAIVLLFWLLILRPAAKRQKDVARMQAALTVGDAVVLTSGVHGVVRGLDAALVDLEIADGVTIRVARGAVGSIVAPTDASEAPAPDPDAPDASPSDAGEA